MKKLSALFWTFVIGGLCASFSLVSYGQKKREAVLNKLFGPGPLIEGHADLENGQCLKCHEAGSGISDVKCMACHKEIRADVEKGKSYHGLLKNSCTQCHSDHKGREYDSTLFDENKFNHDGTGYKLVGAHAKVQCAECHKEKRTKKPLRQEGTRFFHKWPIEQKECRACHEDVHKNNLSPRFQNGKCVNCHNQNTWDIKSFPHKQLTGYELRGRHGQIRCLECHKQDSKLITQNKKLFKWVGLKTDCLSCHKDYHAFSFATSATAPFKTSSKFFGHLNQCLNCHNEQDWKQTHGFDHNKQTRYPLTGKHKEVDCNECHVKEEKGRKPLGRYHWQLLESKTCENCHASPHKKSFSPAFLKKKCTDCHVTEDWFKTPTTGGEKTKGENKFHFNHDETRFKLTDRHLRVACAECHQVKGQDVYKFPSFAKNFCVDCHKNPHQEQFHENFSTQACNECHTTENFSKIKKFDHNLTAFKLSGAHKELACNECHTPVEKAAYDNKNKMVQWHQFQFPGWQEKSCMTCHADYHKGQLSTKCLDCHTEKTWKSPTFDHHTQSRFKLLGQHGDVKCSACHVNKKGEFVEFGPQKKKYPVVHYKPMKTDCFSCHAKDDIHRGQFGQTCQRCHIERDWKLTRDFHKNFKLRGQHFSLTCSECHVDDRRLAGTGETCRDCHQKDDIHRGTLPRCQECHRQQMWEQTTFRHTLAFPLSGAHRTLDCVECHKNNIYQGTPRTCIGCHAADAAAQTLPVHVMPAYMNCFECHNRFTFQRK